MIYDEFCCYFLYTCQVDCQGDLVVHFTMLMPKKHNFPSLTCHWSAITYIKKIIEKLTYWWEFKLICIHPHPDTTHIHKGVNECQHIIMNIFCLHYV